MRRDAARTRPPRNGDTTTKRINVKQLISHSLKMHKVQTASIIASIAASVMIMVTFGLVWGGVQQGIDVSKARGGADVMAIPSS